MKRFALLCLTAACLALPAKYAMGDQGLRFARTHSWHAPYYYTAFGRPVPLIVPPTAHMQSRQGWGVTYNTTTPIYHQFRRPWSGPATGPAMGGYHATPQWPSHTDQFGVYYIRGPW